MTELAVRAAQRLTLCGACWGCPGSLARSLSAQPPGALPSALCEDPALAGGECHTGHPRLTVGPCPLVGGESTW